jgi:beta-lactamase superfamily II metal-dependent hydrolase
MAFPSWVDSLKSHIWIFNVDRGLCVFIRTGLNQGIMYDFGNSDDFRPSDFIKEQIIPFLNEYKQNKISQTIISHPHIDHISNISCLFEPDIKSSPFYAALHTCPHDKTDSAKPESIDWKRIKNPKGSEDTIKLYRSLYENRQLPLQTICFDSARSIPNLEYGIYYVRPPVVNEIYPDNDQEYGNGISLVLFYRHGNHTLLIPGDINPKGLNHILDEGEGLEKRYTIFDRGQNSKHPTWHERTENQPSLRSSLKEHGLSVLIAPHHGLKSGFSKDLYESIRGSKPGLVVISEKRHFTDADGEVDPFYQSQDGAIGQYVYIEGKKEFRYSVSTRSGHHILILFQGTGGQPEVYLEKDPNILLEKLR